MAPLTKALIALILLSTATTVLSSLPAGLPEAGALALLVLSGWKARVILNSYLGLGGSRFWRRGFNGAIMVFLVAVFALYLFPSLQT